MAKPNLSSFAKKVCDSMLVGQKSNPGIEKAKRAYSKKFITRLLAHNIINLKRFSKSEQKIISALQKFKYGPLIAEIDSKLIVKKTVGETVRIAYTEKDADAVKLADAVREECWRRGCSVLKVPLSDESSRRALILSPKTALVEANPLSEAVAKNTDVRFFIGYDEDMNWSKGLSKKKKLTAPFSMYIRKIIDDKKTRWCLLGLPVQMKKQDYLVPRKTYEKVFYDSLSHTYTQETKKLTDYYYRALKGADKIRITAEDGTDLSFSIKKRPLLTSTGIMTEQKVKDGDVGLNIPDGEVFCAPLETTANGRILFDKVFPEGFGLIENLWITFKNGRVVDYSADGDGAERFRKFLDSNSGEKDRIAELGIGTNKKAKFIGAILIDEKIYGTVHIAIGNNTGAYHGKNTASSHLDMIKQMKGRQGNLYADGKLIMKNGEPIKKY